MVKTQEAFRPKEILLERPPHSGSGATKGQTVVRLAFDDDGKLIAVETHFTVGEFTLTIKK